LDNIEQRQIIELIDNRIKSWWENSPESTYHINGVPFPPKNYLLKGFDLLSKHANNITQEINSLKSEIYKIQIKFDNVTIENQKLKNEIDQLKIKISQEENKSNASPIASMENNKKSVASIPSDNIIKIFNDWASELKTNLSSQFFYADGELKLREKQNITRTDNNKSLWIINKSGNIKYLFPNPNAIDEIGGNIDTVYTVTGTRKAKGQNRVNILKACEINDDGWIEYKGELTLL